MFKSIILLMALLVSVDSYSYPKTPYIDIAPGHLCTQYDKDFDRYRYKEDVPYCRRNVSYSRKNKICALYGVYDRTDYTVDHIIPLSMGGSNHNKNLWCQHRKIYTGHLEYQLYKQLEDGKTRQVQALLTILSHKYNPRESLPLQLLSPVPFHLEVQENKDLDPLGLPSF